MLSAQSKSAIKKYKSDNFLLEVLKNILKPSLLLLCLAGGIRQGGGLVWAYNVKSYFSQYYCSSSSVGTYLSWVPLVGGTFGAVTGGLVSDKLAQQRGQIARLWVIIVSQLLACPFLVGVMYLPPDPWAFICLLPAYVIGEVWIGVCLAVVIELVPRRIIPAAVAFFLFVINNIGGAMPLLIPSLQAKITFRYTLLILFPGSYFLAACVFAVALLVILSPSPPCCNKHVPEERRFLIQVDDEEPSLVDERGLLESQESLVTVTNTNKNVMIRNNL